MTELSLQPAAALDSVHANPGHHRGPALAVPSPQTDSIATHPDHIKTKEQEVCQSPE